ncbi:DUF4097 family beta strand repeat-containing protein [Nocardia sp. NPDC003482]
MTSFQTPAPIAVTVDVLSADVTVIASDRADTVVEIRPADATKKGDVRAAEQTTVEFDGDTLSVTTPRDWRTYSPFGGNPTIAVTVAVPTGSRLAATTGVGRLLVTGEIGQCDLEIAAGDIIVEQPGDSVTAKTAKGDIRIGEAVRGVLRLETSVGELEVGIRPGGARLEVNALSGTVQNMLDPVASNAETVRVHARNALGNVVIRHAATV